MLILVPLLRDSLINCFSNGKIMPLIGLITKDFSYNFIVLLSGPFEFYGFIKLLTKVMLSVDIDIYILLYYY